MPVRYDPFVLFSDGVRSSVSFLRDTALLGVIHNDIGAS
jgi:hypothetical protein